MCLFDVSSWMDGWILLKRTNLLHNRTERRVKVTLALYLYDYRSPIPFHYSYDVVVSWLIYPADEIK